MRASTTPGEMKNADTYAGRRLPLFLHSLYSRRSSAIGTSIVLLFLLLAFIGPVLVPYQVNEQLVDSAGLPPSTSHWFGTDNLGRDIFSRVVLGARDILLLAGVGTLLAVLIGTSLGLLSGYRGGWLDEVLMRLFDSLLAIPALLFALLLLGVVGPSRTSILIVIIIVYVPIVTRVVRSVVLTEKHKGYITAARLGGERTTRILFREILPATFPALSVESSLRFSYAIFLVASLGFLGVGVQPPNPDWGLMVNEARTYASQTPWALFFPAAAIVILVVGVNLLTDGIRRLLNDK
ncbi:MAG: ABC transporter permease [Anaerolineales bacterium]